MLTSPRSPEGKANLTNFFLIFFNDFFIDILRSSVKLAINFPFPCLISLETRKTWSILRSLFSPFNHRHLIIVFLFFIFFLKEITCKLRSLLFMKFSYSFTFILYINYALIFFFGREVYSNIRFVNNISNQPTKSLQILGFGTLLLYR